MAENNTPIEELHHATLGTGKKDSEETACCKLGLTVTMFFKYCF